MAASISGRSTFLRSIRSISKSSRGASPSVTPNFMLPHSPLPPLRPSSSSSPLFPVRRLPRQLSSLLPVHSAVASACLVSKLSAEPATSIQGRFANYLSPI